MFAFFLFRRTALLCPSDERLFIAEPNFSAADFRDGVPGTSPFCVPPKLISGGSREEIPPSVSWKLYDDGSENDRKFDSFIIKLAYTVIEGDLGLIPILFSILFYFFERLLNF